MRRTGSSILGLALGFTLGATAVMAQGSGGLRVTLIDTQGDPVGGRTVVLRHDAGRLAPQQATTDERGTAEFPVLAAEGGWTLGVGMSAGNEIRQKVEVVLGAMTPVLIRLTDAPDAAPGRAPGGAPDIDTTAGITRFPEEFVRDLPVPGRFYQRVLPLAPGVNDGDGDGNPRVHGATSRDFRALVNGIANVDPVTQQFMSFTNSDSIEQIAVIPTGAGLEFGRAQGGFAAITQKIGGNTIAASAEIRYRGSDLDGTGTAADGTGEVEFQSVQPSALVSGPIVKDKLWYRLAWERVDQELPIDVGTGTVVQTRDQTLQAYQLTWQAAPRHRLALQYQSNPLEIEGFGVDSSVPLESTQRVDIESDTLSLVWTVPWSSRLLVETTVAAQERSTRLAPETTGVANDCVLGLKFLEQSFCDSGVGLTSGSYFRSTETDADRMSLSSRATWQIGRTGGTAHLLRAGFVYEHDSVDRLAERATRSSLFVYDGPFAKFTPEPVIMLASSVPLAATENDTARADSWAVYVEDSIRPMRNLTIEVGLRIDRDEIETAGLSTFDPAAEQAAFLRDLEGGVGLDAFRHNFTAYEAFDTWGSAMEAQTGIRASDWFGRLPNVIRQSAFWPNKRRNTGIVIRNTNTSPRLAVSWDPWNNGRSKFAASARRYYGGLLPAAPLLATEAAATSMLNRLEADPRYELPVVDRLGSQMAIDAVMVDPDLETPYQDEWRLSYERELWKENRLHIEYLQRDYRDQLQFDEVNRRPGDFGHCRVAEFDNRQTIVASPGAGFELTDPFTGETYIDTDSGDGDGRTDDCVGGFDSLAFDNYGGTYVERPDGRPDDYIQNPAWGSVGRLGNDGRRDYEAFVVEFVRRQFRGWGMQASYVWSRFEGSGEPFDPYIGIDRSRLDPLAGFDSSDQRHVVKVASDGVLPGDWHLGGVVTWQSGLPYSLVVFGLDDPAVPLPFQSLGAIGPTRARMQYLTETRNTERNEAYWRFDMRVAKGFAVGKRARVEVALDVFNLLDETPLQVYNPDTEIGLQVNGDLRGRRVYGRSFQLGLRFAY